MALIHLANLKQVYDVCGSRIGNAVTTSCGKTLLAGAPTLVRAHQELDFCPECLKCSSLYDKSICGFKARSFHVITAKRIIDTGRLSFRFLLDSGVSQERVRDYFGYYGHAQVVNDERGRHWESFVMKTNEGQVFCSGNELPLLEFLSDMPACNLLMDEKYFEEFERACREIGIEVEAYHYDGELRTS
ncbi:MAG: hypothetical protein PHN19_02270 [Patescibacteria group bacterium]|nr:hypothetical protein [Patescibacteria group bacterium]